MIYYYYFDVIIILQSQNSRQINKSIKNEIQFYEKSKYEGKVKTSQPSLRETQDKSGQKIIFFYQEANIPQKTQFSNNKDAEER